MADVKISQLTTITPDLLDEIIVNDVVGESKTTHRATLQDVRNLANQNIDDMSAGGGVVLSQMEMDLKLLVIYM